MGAASVDARRAFLAHPFSEGEKGGALNRGANTLGQATKDLRLAYRLVPDNRSLIVGIEQRLSTIELSAQRDCMALRLDRPLVAPRQQQKGEEDESC